MAPRKSKTTVPASPKPVRKTGLSKQRVAPPTRKPKEESKALHVGSSPSPQRTPIQGGPIDSFKRLRLGVSLPAVRTLPTPVKRDGMLSGIVLPPVTEHQGVTLSGPNIATNLPGPKVAEQLDTERMGQNAAYAFGVLQPYISMSNGSYPKYPDGNLSATATWASCTVIAAPTINTFIDGYSGSGVSADPFGYVSIYTASDEKNITGIDYQVDQSLAAAAADFSLVRCVGIQMMSRNPEKIVDQSGVVIQGNALVSTLQSYLTDASPTSVLPSCTDIVALRSNTQTFTRSGNNPGDIGITTWAPASVSAGMFNTDYKDAYGMQAGLSCADNVWMDPTILVDTGSLEAVTGALNQTTCVFSMTLSPAGVPSSQEIVVIRLWEGIPRRTVAPIIQPTVSLGELDAAKRAIMVALQVSPRMSISRNVWRDDGVAQAVVDDVKSIVGTGARLLGTAKNIGQSLWSGITSLFGDSMRRTAAALHQKDLIQWMKLQPKELQLAYDALSRAVYRSVKYPEYYHGPRSICDSKSANSASPPTFVGLSSLTTEGSSGFATGGYVVVTQDTHVAPSSKLVRK